MRTSSFIVVLFCLYLSHELSAQINTDSTELENVEAVIHELFDAYRAGDSTRVRAVFTGKAVLQRAYYDQSQFSHLSDMTSVDVFVKYIGAGLSQLHDEQLWNMKTHVNHNLASVWAEFAFFLDGKLHHCGVENFLLHKEDDGSWKIFHLVDTHEVDGCQVPDSIMEHSSY